MWDERGRGAAPARTVVSRSACAGGRVERTLNDTEMVRRKTQPALQPPAPLGGWPCAGASYLLLFRSPAPPTMCQVHSTPTLRRGAHLSSDFTWNIGQALALRAWHRHMNNSLTVRKAKRREIDCKSGVENRVHSNLNGVSLTEDILSKREYAWLPRTEGARAPRHRLKKIYARYVLQTFSTAKTQRRHSAGNLNLIKSRLSETLLGCPWQAGGMSSASASGRAIEVARYVYDPSNSPRSAHKFGKALENLDRMVPPAAPFVALLLASA